MKALREGKPKLILESSISSAITAVEIYNKPNADFRIETYIVLMVIAWTKLFHSYFHRAIGEKYFYRRKNGRFEKIKGERKAWELSECIKQYKKLEEGKKVKILSAPVEANLRFFIGIRNKIEHRYYKGSDLDAGIFGECQALLYNYENFLESFFGERYRLDANLAYSLQFSKIRVRQQITSQKSASVEQARDLVEYVRNYRASLSQEVYDSQDYSLKVYLVPKISGSKRGDLAVEFVDFSDKDPSDRENFNKIDAIVKEKIVRVPVLNPGVYKVKEVIGEVNVKINDVLNRHLHTKLWKAFKVRPNSEDQDKSKTISRFCIYDELHKDYAYTQDWIRLLISLFFDPWLHCSEGKKFGGGFFDYR